MRQIASEDAIRARGMISQYLFKTTMSSESGDAKEDHEVAASGSGDH